MTIGSGDHGGHLLGAQGTAEPVDVNSDAASLEEGCSHDQAEACSLLATHYSFEGMFGNLSPEEGYAKAYQYNKRACELGSDWRALIRPSHYRSGWAYWQIRTQG